MRSMQIYESKTHPVSCAVIIGVCPRLHELCTSKIALMSCFSASKQGHALQSKPRNHETWQWRTARRSIPCIAAMTSIIPPRTAINIQLSHKRKVMGWWPRGSAVRHPAYCASDRVVEIYGRSASIRLSVFNAGHRMTCQNYSCCDEDCISRWVQPISSLNTSVKL